jgi:putative flavoprotein involved in K+ transport
MAETMIDTLVIGGGQAGLAMSEHLGRRGVSHLVVERARIAERWRSERWDSLVANGPAWHDRFPTLTFDGMDSDGFAGRDRIVDYFERYAAQIAAPIRCGVNVHSLQRSASHDGFVASTNHGVISARRVVVATGPFQRPLVPTVVPAELGITQLHSSLYRRPEQLPEGAVLVVGAGSSGVQIADELVRSGRQVYLCVGPHNRPPRRYRGRDFVWWLGVLGEWDAKTIAPGMEHVTIAVSGARGGHTVDFRDLAQRGITLVGTAGACVEGVLHFGDDLARNIARGDANYLAMLDAADAYAQRMGLDLPPEPTARVFAPPPACVSSPLSELDLRAAGVSTIIWATGYALDFSWIDIDVFDPKGRPIHERGVSSIAGLYFLGLAWLSRRASPFIWGVWHDADFLASQIAGPEPTVV